MGILMPDDEINRIVKGNLFSMHAKNPGQEYDNTARMDEYQRQLADNQQLISEGMNWAENYLSQLDLPEILPRPLIE